MLPATRRRIFTQKILFMTLLLLLLGCCYLIYLQLGKFQRTSENVQSSYYRLPRMQLEQNGDYWICNNFMRSSSTRLRGNASITLTTHGTYRDFGHMDWLLVRWNGPISMAVYVHPGDSLETLRKLYYIKYCTSGSHSWSHYVSLQLVFSDNQMPRLFQQMVWKRIAMMPCTRLVQKNPSSRGLKNPYNSSYPLHLLRNVARLNAETLYVFPLEPGMLPTQHFIRNFFGFLHRYHPRKRLKSVYCIPIFPQVGEDLQLPKYKSQLLEQWKPHLHENRTLSAFELRKLDKWRSWLANPIRDGDIRVYLVTKSPHSCAAYVSSNADEPFYDQRYAESIYDTNSSKLQVLVGLGFDFVVLDGTFLIHRNSSSQLEYSREALHQANSRQKLKHIRDLIKLNTFAQDNRSD
ncbi:uncharacterized protein LOC135439099 [Drosophila montana]|uniref:uncharacterized protein LOC135439099 n=1 Tax=Drosophila montana TaxID=40370 RepID=UPI00313B06DA